MRKLKIIEHISLDGVIQAPGGPDEDGDYPYGGWTRAYRDPAAGEVIFSKRTGSASICCLGGTPTISGRKFWPKAASSPLADGLNAATNTSRPTGRTVLNGGRSKLLDRTSSRVSAASRRRMGPRLIVWGSSTLTPVLLEDGLADEILLFVYPVLLGKGETFLFGYGAAPRELVLTGTEDCGSLASSSAPTHPADRCGPDDSTQRRPGTD